MDEVENQSLTREAAEFAAALRYQDLPADVLHIARRCIIDGLAVMLAGSAQPALLRREEGCVDSRGIACATLSYD